MTMKEYFPSAHRTEQSSPTSLLTRETSRSLLVSSVTGATSLEEFLSFLFLRLAARLHEVGFAVVEAG